MSAIECKLSNLCVIFDAVLTFIKQISSAVSTRLDHMQNPSRLLRICGEQLMLVCVLSYPLHIQTSLSLLLSASSLPLSEMLCSISSTCFDYIYILHFYEFTYPHMPVFLFDCHHRSNNSISL